MTLGTSLIKTRRRDSICLSPSEDNALKPHEQMEEGHEDEAADLVHGCQYFLDGARTPKEPEADILVEVADNQAAFEHEAEIDMQDVLGEPVT